MKSSPSFSLYGEKRGQEPFIALLHDTEGRGSMTMEFDHYNVVPGNVTEETVSNRK